MVKLFGYWVYYLNVVVLFMWFFCHRLHGLVLMRFAWHRLEQILLVYAFAIVIFFRRLRGMRGIHRIYLLLNLGLFLCTEHRTLPHWFWNCNWFFPAECAEFTEYICCLIYWNLILLLKLLFFLPQIARIGTDALRLTQIRTDFIR